jgi:protein-tyrosine phosphatase
MITDNVAVGNYLSSYEPFDVIVNMCFPQNGVTHRQIDIQQSMNNGRVKLLIRIGVNDDPSEDMGSLLSKLIPYLVALRRQYPAITILFHCFAGISRSSTAAIAYLMAVENISLQEAYQMVKNKRPIIQPNEGFIKALLSYKKDDYVVRI